MTTPRRFFKLHGQFADERLETLVVPAQAFLFGLRATLLEDLGSILQQAIPPLVILGLADLVAGAQLGQRHGGLESFENDLQLLGTAPFATFHWRGFFRLPTPYLSCSP